MAEPELDFGAVGCRRAGPHPTDAATFAPAKLNLGETVVEVAEVHFSPLPCRRAP